MRNNKSKGFTLIEVMIVLSITVTILGVIYGVFNSNNKALIDVDVKSTLQAESLDMRESISNMCMEAKSIKEVRFDNKGNIVKIVMNVPDSLDDSKNTILLDNNGELRVGGKTVSRHLVENQEFPTEKIFKLIKSDKSVLDKPIGSNVILEDDLKDIKSATFKFVLYKQRGYSKVSYPVDITVNFRNAE